jgi:hypothetical protein
MTGYTPEELIRRAEFVCRILRLYDIEPIHPVLKPGEDIAHLDPKLLYAPKDCNESYDSIKPLWKYDKDAILRSHVVIFDRAWDKSIGMEREYGFARYCLWKPCIPVMEDRNILTIASYEDDHIARSIHDAAKYIVKHYGTRPKRFLWRVKMLCRTLPKWFYRQAIQWR